MSCLPTKSAAAYNLAWNTHWSTTRIGLLTSVWLQIESSVKTHNPKLVIKVSIPWFTSGSTWYGLPAKTIPFKLFLFMYSKVSSPLSRISCLNFWYSSSAFFAAANNSFLVKLYSANSGNSMIVSASFLQSKGKNGFKNLILFSFNSSTLFFKTSEYEITIGQL